MYEEEEKNYDKYYELINSCYPKPSYEELNFFRVRKAFCLFKLGRYYDAYMIGQTPYIDEKFYKNYCVSGLSLVRLKKTDQKKYKDIKRICCTKTITTVINVVCFKILNIKAKL